MKPFLAAFALLALLAPVATASGTLQPGFTSPPPDAPDRDPFQVTKTVKAQIVLLKAPNKVLIRKDGEDIPLLLAENARLRARNRKLFDGRKRLTFEDLAIGQEVKVSYKPHTHRIVKIRVLRLPESDS